MEYLERLFADTESRLRSEKRIDFLEETDQLRRAEEATSSLAARLMGGRGVRVSIDMRYGQTARLVIKDCSSQWLLGTIDSKEILIPLEAIMRVKGLSAGTVGDFSGPVTRNMSFASALRTFGDKHREVVVRMGSLSMAGKIVRVGRDCLDLMCVGEVILISFASIDSISEKGY